MLDPLNRCFSNMKATTIKLEIKNRNTFKKMACTKRMLQVKSCTTDHNICPQNHWIAQTSLKLKGNSMSNTNILRLCSPFNKQSLGLGFKLRTWNVP
jgi:hypothetical protein